MTEAIKTYILRDIELFGAEYAIKKLYDIDPDILTYRTPMDYIEDEKSAEYREIYMSIIKYIAKDINILDHTVDAVTSNGDTIEGAYEYHNAEFFFHSYQFDGMETHEDSAASCYIGTVLEGILKNIENKRRKENGKYE